MNSDKEEIIVNGEKIEVVTKMNDEEKEDNNLKKYLDDTIDLKEVVEKIKYE